MKKKTSRQELRRQVKELTRECDQLMERLDATTKELKLHAIWCGEGLKRPGRIQTLMNKVWVKLTRQTNA